MSIKLEEILSSINRIISLMNDVLLGLCKAQPHDFKRAIAKKTALVPNLLLLALLVFIVFVMNYGEYRRVKG